MQFAYAGRPLPSFIKFAIHVLAISTNSALCKRLFSVFGNTLTKLRTRLGLDNLTQLSELKLHNWDQHLRAKEARERLKRQFGVDKENMERARRAQEAERQGTVTQATTSNQSDNDEDISMTGRLQPKSHAFFQLTAPDRCSIHRAKAPELI